MKKSKRFLAIIGVIAIIACILTIAVCADASTSEYFRVLFNSTVRSGKGTNYSSLGTASVGSLQRRSVIPYSYVYNTTSWSEITWQGGYGFLRNDLICPDDIIYRVNVSTSARIRSTPTSSSYITVPDNTVLQRVNNETRPDSSTNYVWYNVLVRTTANEGYIGWIRSDLVTIGY